MNYKEIVRNMIAFLEERHDMDFAEVQSQFAMVYGMSEEDAKKVILELTMLKIFSNHFSVEI